MPAISIMITEMPEEVMLTTVDNPYNPFTHYDDWLMYDITHNYNTNGYLARIAKTADSFTDKENAEAIRDAIYEIVRYDVFDMYRAVTRDSKFGPDFNK